MDTEKNDNALQNTVENTVQTEVEDVIDESDAPDCDDKYEVIDEVTGDNDEENEVNEENQVNQENQVNEENQVNAEENQVNDKENQVNDEENQEKDEEKQEENNENQDNAEENQVDDKEKQVNDTEVSDSNVEGADTTKPLSTDSDVKTAGEAGETQTADTSQSPKDKAARKRGAKTPKGESCDKYGWPIGSKYCTEVKDAPAKEANFADDVDLANYSEDGDSTSKNASGQPNEEVLFSVKSPFHRTANTKRTIIKVEEVEGAITDGIQAGTHLPHFLNYLSWQVKFKLTLSRQPDGKLKIIFRFVGKGGDSLKSIICLWLRREDEDKDKIICEGLTRTKEEILVILAQKLHEIENLSDDPVALYEEIKKLVPEYRGKEGLRSEDETFLTSYRDLESKLHRLLMLLYKEGCGSKLEENRTLSQFRDLYFSLQMKPGLTVKQYLHAFYFYNLIFSTHLPRDLEELMQKYATMKNIVLPDTPPLVIPPGGQKKVVTVINPFAKKKLQSPKQGNQSKDNSYAEYEMVPVKLPDGTVSKAPGQTNPKPRNEPRKRPANRRNRGVIAARNAPKNVKNQKIVQGRRIANPRNLSNPRGNVRNPPNQQNPRDRRNIPNRRDPVRPGNTQNPRNPTVQRNPVNLGNLRNKRRPAVQGGGSPAKKRPLNRAGSKDNLPNPAVSGNQGVQENSNVPRNQSNQPKLPNRKNQRRFPRERRNLPIEQRRNQNEQRNNLPNPRNNVPNQRNNQPNQRNNQPNQRNNQPNQRNNQPNQRNNQPNQRNNQSNQRNNQANMRNEKNNQSNARRNQSRLDRSRRRAEFRKRGNDQFSGMSDLPRNQGLSPHHEYLLNSLRNQDMMQNNLRNQDMGRNQFNNDRNSGFNDRNQGFNNERNQSFNSRNFPQGNSSRNDDFMQNNSPRSLFAQQYFEMSRNQNYSPNNSGNFSPPNSRRSSGWPGDMPGGSQNYFSGSSNFPNRSMNRNSGDMQFSNFNSRMSFDDDRNSINFSNSTFMDNDFNRGKRKNPRDDWGSKRPKQGT